MLQLYGDGLHDDTLAIQERLDTGEALVELPVPSRCYLISKTLKIHSYQELRLSRYCHIKLAPKSDCFMITNSDKINGNENITVSGGIWDFDNQNQSPNPFLQNPSIYKMPTAWGVDDRYEGFAMHFFNIKNLVIRDLTIKDPTTFALSLDKVSYFTVENIVFDFNEGNPYPVNMDGVHLNGNCHFGMIRNIKGTTYDDMIALNADEGSNGPITNIDIDGLYADRCQTFIRLLTRENVVENIHIHNLYGTCFMYGIGITKWYSGETLGYYNNLVFDNLYIKKGESVFHPDYPRWGIDTFAMISAESETVVKSLHIADMYRDETLLGTPTIEIQEGCVIENLSMDNCCDNSEMNFPMVLNKGRVKELHQRNVRTVSGEAWVGNAPDRRGQ